MNEHHVSNVDLGFAFNAAVRDQPHGDDSLSEREDLIEAPDVENLTHILIDVKHDH